MMWLWLGVSVALWIVLIKLAGTLSSASLAFVAGTGFGILVTIGLHLAAWHHGQHNP